VTNRDYGHPPTTREQSLEQEIEQLRSEVARLMAELNKTTNKHRYFNPIYGWVDDHLRKEKENDRA